MRDGEINIDGILEFEFGIFLRFNFFLIFVFCEIVLCFYYIYVLLFQQVLINFVVFNLIYLMYQNFILNYIIDNVNCIVFNYIGKLDFNIL